MQLSGTWVSLSHFFVHVWPLSFSHFFVHVLWFAEDPSKVGLLKGLPYADKRLVLFRADIYNAEEFEPAIRGCDFVFHVATPMMHSTHSTKVSSPHSHFNFQIVRFLWHEHWFFAQQSVQILYLLFMSKLKWCRSSLLIVKIHTLKSATCIVKQRKKA